MNINKLSLGLHIDAAINAANRLNPENIKKKRVCVKWLTN